MLLISLGRAQTIMFSQKAVICQRDGEYYLLFRVGDMRKSHIIGTSMRALLVKNRLTREGKLGDTKCIKCLGYIWAWSRNVMYNSVNFGPS